MTGTAAIVTSTLDAFEQRMRSGLSAATMAQTILGAGEVVAGEIRKAIASWGDAPSGLSSKTGALARSFRPLIVRQNQDAIVLGVYSGLPYADIQDVGGVITAKNGRFLAIPLTPAARRVSPRDWPGGLTAIVKGNSGVLIPKRARTGRRQKGEHGPMLPPSRAGQALYALKTSVTLPAHGYIAVAGQTALPKAAAFIRQRLAQALKSGRIQGG